MTSIATFENTPDGQKTITLIGLQILNQAKLMDEAGVEYVKKPSINQL
jgi:hypothetical protein